MRAFDGTGKFSETRERCSRDRVWLDLHAAYIKPHMKGCQPWSRVVVHRRECSPQQRNVRTAHLFCSTSLRHSCDVVAKMGNMQISLLPDLAVHMLCGQVAGDGKHTWSQLVLSAVRLLSQILQAGAPWTVIHHFPVLVKPTLTQQLSASTVHQQLHYKSLINHQACWQEQAKRQPKSTIMCNVVEVHWLRCT